MTELSPPQPGLTEDSGPSGLSRGRADPFRTPAAAAVATVLSGLYVAFVEYYSVNVPKGDKWVSVLTVWDNLLPPLQGLLAALPLVKILREDRLSVFAPSAYRAWATQGPPEIAGC